MNDKPLFVVVETDARQTAAAAALARNGCAVAGAEAIAQADYILLPLPMDEERLGLAQLLRAARPGALALGGKVSPRALQIAGQAGVELVDYFTRPELTALNAIPTAEGCIALLMQRRRRTLWDAPVLLVGYGQVGRALAARLHGLGARVTVAARRAGPRAEARSAGCAAIPMEELPRAAPGFDAVVNTVPAPVVTERVLAALPPESLVIDLASRPGGVDHAAAKALGHTSLAALSLPALCAPVSAGEYVARTVLEILAERQLWPERSV